MKTFEFLLEITANNKAEAQLVADRVVEAAEKLGVEKGLVTVRDADEMMTELESALFDGLGY